MSHFKGPEFATGLPDFQPNTSVLKLIAESLQKNGDNTAMVEGQTGKTSSFAEILRQSTAISCGLRNAGLGAGDYVIFCCDKSVSAYSAVLGAIFTGATAIMYPIPHADCISKLTKGFPIKAVFCDAQSRDTFTKSMKSLNPQPALVAVTEPQDDVFRSLLSTQGNLELYEVKDLRNHFPMIFFSSGTTGEPKGIPLTNILLQLCGRYLQTKAKTFFVTSPFFWLSAWLTLMSSLFENFKIVTSNSTSPEDSLRLMEKYKADTWFTGTGSLPRFTNEPSLPLFDLSALKLLIVGGETTLSNVVEDFKAKVLRGRVKIKVGYGTTECGPQCLVDLAPDSGKFPCGLGGKPNPGAEVKITDDAGKVVPVGSLGEVWIKTLALFPGYWGRPPVEDFDQDGFFRMGDAGFFNEQGMVFLRGRVGDLINYKGTKLSPAEVEDILMSHPGVHEAAVVGKPHPTDTQHMTAYVVKKTGQDVSAEELQSLVDGNVEDNLRLRGGVHFLDALPRTIIGKVVRKKLREM